MSSGRLKGGGEIHTTAGPLDHYLEVPSHYSFFSFFWTHMLILSNVSLKSILIPIIKIFYCLCAERTQPVTIKILLQISFKVKTSSVIILSTICLKRVQISYVTTLNDILDDEELADEVIDSVSFWLTLCSSVENCRRA